MHKVDLYCAALYRQGFVIQTINSLKDQPEFGTCTVTCNNHTDDQWQEMFNIFSGDTRIKFYRHNNEKASNEKLRYLADGENPYIMLIDNDLIYPEDYLQKLIAGCNFYNGMVSCHGVILAGGLIQSYYKDRHVFRGLGSVPKDYEVDISSNCGSLWKRKWFNNYNDWIDFCGETSMDDLYVAYFMKKKGIHKYCLKHPEGYLKHKVQEAGDDYVFDRHKYNDTIQTVFINSFYKKL